MEEENKDFIDEIKNAQAAQFPDFTKVNQDLQAKAKSGVYHSPIQQGPFIICRSCDHQHTIAFIGTEKMLVGVEQNGEPIIKDR